MLADRHFYETPDRLSAPGTDTAAPLFDTARREVPEGWSSARIGDWLTLTPLDEDGGPLPGPPQGWKIRASDATGCGAPRGVVDPEVGFAAEPLREDRSHQTRVVHQK